MSRLLHLAFCELDNGFQAIPDDDQYVPWYKKMSDCHRMAFPGCHGVKAISDTASHISQTSGCRRQLDMTMGAPTSHVNDVPQPVGHNTASPRSLLLFSCSQQPLGACRNSRTCKAPTASNRPKNGMIHSHP